MASNGTNGVKMDWQDIVKQKRQERQQLIAPYSSITTEELEKRPINLHAIHERTSLSTSKGNTITDENEIEVLLEQMQTGKLSAETLTRTYIER